MSFAQPSLKGCALRLLSLREHSRVEFERKLARFEEEEGTLTKALDELQAKGFISEARVIESVLHRRAGKLGAARIKQELQGKGLDADAVREALVGLQKTERERAKGVWQQKFGTAPINSKEAARQIRFLASRGFSTDAIRTLVLLTHWD